MKLSTLLLHTGCYLWLCNAVIWLLPSEVISIKAATYPVLFILLLPHKLVHIPFLSVGLYWSLKGVHPSPPTASHLADSLFSSSVSFSVRLSMTNYPDPGSPSVSMWPQHRRLVPPYQIGFSSNAISPEKHSLMWLSLFIYVLQIRLSSILPKPRFDDSWLLLTFFFFGLNVGPLVLARQVLYH
jgi:hypothetical protein